MKVEIDVSKDSLTVEVDGFELDVYADLGEEIVEDAIKKYVWLSSIAYEVERRVVRFAELEKKEYMGHWREWAVKWLKGKDMPETMATIDSTVARIFGNSSISEKVDFSFDISSMMSKRKRGYDTWGQFFKDSSVNDKVKDNCKKMFKLEMERNMTYEKVIDLEARMQSIVQTLKVAARGYNLKSQKDGKLRL